MAKMAVKCARCGQPMSDVHECAPLRTYAISTMISARKHQSDPGTPAIIHRAVVKAASAEKALRKFVPQPGYMEWPTVHYMDFAVCYEDSLAWVATIAPVDFSLL